MYEMMDKPKNKRESSANNTGIPNAMKEKFEQRSGISFDDVRVHYNSSKPVQFQALAYTQGNQIYVGPGQEKHLAHELGHIVQQKQGIVKPTGYLNGIPLNNDPALEEDADKISSTPHPSAVPSDSHAFLSDPTPADFSQPRIVQAFSAQWDGEVIQNIQFDRPPISELNERELFPNWVSQLSSSHTTAFVVIRRELELRLLGKSFYQALDVIRQMTLNIQNLPGYLNMPIGPNPDPNPTVNHFDDKPRVDQQIYDIVNGINELANAPAPFSQTNRNIIIEGYAKRYFICRNSIYYTFHLYGNGGGANHEAKSIASLESVPDVAADADLREDATLKQAYQHAVSLLDTNYVEEVLDEYKTVVAQQHFLSIASFFQAQGKNILSNIFFQITQYPDLMKEIIETYSNADGTDYQPEEEEGMEEEDE